MKHFRLTLVGSLFFMGLLGIAPAHAYLDPGSGSMLLQLLLGGIAGIGLIAKMYWERIKQFFGGKSNSLSKPDEDESDK